jgi:hypothetical protein
MHSDPDPHSLADIERTIAGLMRDVARATDEVHHRAQAAARAEVTYRVKFAQQMLQAEGSMDLRKAAAEVACEKELGERKMAEALLMSAQEAGRSHRARLDAARTVCANVRASLGTATGFGG